MSLPMTGTSHPPSDVTSAPPASNGSGLGPVGDWLGSDWPVQASDRIERVVDNVRRKTTGPAVVASRAVVYGLISVPFAIAALVLFLTAFVRGLDAVLPTWSVHLIIGAVLCAAGLLCWTRRTAKNGR